MKTTYIVAIIIVLLIIGVAAVSLNKQPYSITSGGVLALKITDAAVNITSFQVTISKIEVHKAESGEDREKPENETSEGEEENETSDDGGWITVMTGPKTIDLIEVKDLIGLLGETELSPGIYTQVRMYVDSATAVIDGQTVNARIPSKVIRFIHPFRIQANSTTSVIIDFDADRSLVLANGSYILKPTVKTLTEFTAFSKHDADEREQEQETEADNERQQRGTNRRPVTVDVPEED